jgi:H+/Cl- antiporter ClcA
MVLNPKSHEVRPGGYLALGGLALGGGGLAHLIIRLFIWHEIWRLIRYLWLIPTFGPFIVVLLVLSLVGFAIWRRNGRSWGRRRRGSAGYGSGTGPRDW